MPYPVPLQRILSLADPTACPPWECGILLTLADVMTAFKAKDWLEHPVAEHDDENPYLHARRIAYLAYHGWQDPIELDVGIPAMHYHPPWPVLDGNHRLYAAVVRRDSHILVSVAGDLGYAARRFGIKMTLLAEEPA